VVEINEAFEHGRSDRDADERAGMGLLSRFIGAVLLVLLGGLLLLDRSLLRANESQAALDAQSAALLVESYVAVQVQLLARIADRLDQSPTQQDSSFARTATAKLFEHTPELRYIWVEDAAGRRLFGLQKGESDALPENSKRSGMQRGDLSIEILPRKAGFHRLVSLEQATGVGGALARVGILLDENGLREWLDRVHPPARLSLNVVSGSDTLVVLGNPELNTQGLAVEQRIVRLATGGTWTVTATHAITTRALRWALWALGVTGVLFLALGLLREQRRVIAAAGRSIELERLYRDVKRANQAKSEFLANVSHELRTPLNAIVGFVELLREGFYGDLSPRQVLPVDRIAASATHLRHLVDQVLDIAKIAAGRLEVHSETIVLRPFVLNTASELESLVSEKGLVFSITVGASLPRVRTDPTHLRQILINLIGNAVKYTVAGTISVRARLVGAPVQAIPQRRSGGTTDETSIRALTNRAPRSGTWIALQVVDTGVGIAAGDLERIFDEFEQVNAGPRGDSMQRGTGLGLAISRRLARLLGGEIGVESEHGHGSTFTIWLPVNPADLARDPVLTPMDNPVASA